ncbi:MAG TPA: START domain-containing protein [Mucilaginibacter sp.]|jgi:ribosome-associated toxin RatA of RatAB toxin-antitoxin module
MYKTLFIALLLILKISPSIGQSDWKLRTETEGIKIYTSLMPDSKIKAIKVEGDYHATASQMVALIMDVNTAPEWVYHTKSCALVKQISPSELYYYSEINLPWPAANRDFVAHLIVTQNPDTKVVTIAGPAVAGFVPIKEGIVRVTDSNGKWVITPKGTDQIKVEYTIHVDPGGSLPSWLVNMFATEGPMKIFRNIKFQLQKRAYKNIELAFVEN